MATLLDHQPMALLPVGSMPNSTWSGQMVREVNGKMCRRTWRPRLLEHRSTIGQMVRTTGARPMASSIGGASFRVAALLASEGEVPQYRVRNELELHARMVTQDTLEPVSISETTQDNPLLIAKTFDLR
jgi:hypothetical protein